MKKSRTFRKSFVAAIAALCLAAPLAVMPMTVSAEGTYSITITATDESTAHKYVAYQIFKGDLSGTVLSNIQWGDGVDSSKLDVTKLNGALGLTGNAELTADKLTASNVAKLLTNGNVGTFAEYIANCLTGAKKPLSQNGEYATDKVNDYIVTGLSAGYYLVEDEATLSNQAAAKTSYILKVVNDVSTNAKSAVPTIVKKVQENTELSDDYTSNGTKYDNYNDVADYNIGDDVPFLDDGTLPSDIGSYDEYYYQIVDTPGEKFTPNIGYDESTGKVNVNTADEDDNEVTVKIDGVKVNPSDVIVEYKDTGTDGNKEIVVTFKNIKDVENVSGTSIPITKNSHVTIEYTAKLDEDAVIGLGGQESKVELNFSNDPNEDYKSTTDSDGPDGIGTTPEDKVIVFTYELDITKYLGEKSNNQKEKEGKAGFKLYKTVDGKEMVATLNANKKITGWEEATNEDAGTQISTDSNGVVKFIGIDEGTYTIKETDTPNGYNTMEPKTIVIAANTLDEATDAVTTVDRQEWTTTADKALLALTCDNVVGDLTNGNVTIDVENFKGSTLPSTGGIGTTIFYLGGGTMAAVAGVYLITKKRMKNEEDDEI